jgi:hypothetical protein
MKWSEDARENRTRWAVFLLPELVNGIWYWLHPCRVQERWISNYGGCGWDIERVLDRTV